MQPNTTTLPDNLKSRISRAYIASRNFKNDSGESVAYERFVIEIMVKGEPFNLEFKLDRKDKAIMALSDIVDQGNITQ